MKKREVLELTKEVLGLSSLKETEARIEEYNTLIQAVSDKLVVDEKDKSLAKAKIGKLELHKVAKKARTGEIKLKDGTKKAYTTEDKEVVKAKLK